LTEKTSYFIQIEKDGKKGIGEAGPLKGLSPEFEADCSETFQRIIQSLPELPTSFDAISNFIENIPFEYPSLRMGHGNGFN
jgi:hypothetical protein